MKEIQYIYSVREPGGAENQCKKYAQTIKSSIVETGGGFQKIFRIYRSVVATTQPTIHVFWLAQDQAFGAFVARIFRKKDSLICFNLRNDPLTIKDGFFAYLFEKVAFALGADLIYSNSQKTIDNFVKAYRVSNAKTKVIPNVIETGKGDWVYSDTGLLEIIFVGHPTYLKGFDVLLEQLDVIGCANISKVHIFGFEKSQLSKAEQKKLDKFKDVSLTTDSHWYRRRYVNAVLLNVSRSEGSPSAPLEALGHSIPVLIPQFISYAREIPQRYVYNNVNEINVARLHDLLRGHKEGLENHDI